MSGTEASRGSVDSATAVPLELNDPVLVRKRAQSSSEQESQPKDTSKKRKIHSSNSDSDSDSPFFRDALTGRCIRVEDATSVIRELQKSSPVDDPIRKLEFWVKERERGSVAKIRTPDEIPFPKMSSGPQPSREEAKNRVYFRLCKKLYALGLLDHRFFPKGSDTQVMTDSEGDTDGASSKTSEATKKFDIKQPQFTVNSLSIASNQFYPLIVEVGPLNGHPHAPMLILGRAPFPKLFNFKVFNGGQNADVSFQPAGPLLLTEEKLNLLHRYTVRVCRSIANKPLDSPVNTFPFLFAPMAKTWNSSTLPKPRWWLHPSVEEHIPWEDVKQAAENWATNLVVAGEEINEDMLEDCILLDRASEFTHRHYAVKLRRDLTPMSKPEAGLRESPFANYLEYVEVRTNHNKGVKNPDQPLIEVAPLPSAVNNLAASCGRVIAQPKFVLKYLIPELSYRFTIPTTTYRTALLLPSITRKLESMLLVKEFNANLFDDTISDELLLEAITCPTVGIEPDYQRLELLGDTYLKQLVATYLFVTMPDSREGPMNLRLGQLVANKKLRNGSLKIGLPSYIQSKPFVTKVWLPFVQTQSPETDSGEPNLSVDTTKGDHGKEKRKDNINQSGKRQRQLGIQNSQWLGDKTIADTVEAIIGAALLSGGHELAFKVAKILGVDIPEVNQWSDLARLSKPTKFTDEPSPEVIQSVQNATGHQFKQPQIIGEALTHSSVPGAPSNYQRLEFLGDAVLDMLVVNYIFDKYPRSTCGQMSLLKSAMVSNQTLGALCLFTGWHNNVQYAPRGEVQRIIAGYSERIHQLKEQEHKGAAAENRLPGQFWLDAEPPKVMSDILESVIGAIFVDEQFNLESLRAIFQRIFEPFYDKYIRLQTLSAHPSTTLMELFQAEHCRSHGLRKEVQGALVQYHVVVHDTVLASGADKSANMAARKASTAALDVLSTDPGFVSRVCDCKSTQSGKKTRNNTPQGYEDVVNVSVAGGIGGVEGA